MIYHILLWYIPLTEKFEQGHLRRQHSVVQHGKIVVTDLKHLQLSRRCFTCVQKVYYCSGLVSLHLVHMSLAAAALNTSPQAVPSYTSKSSFYTG